MEKQILFFGSEPVKGDQKVPLMVAAKELGVGYSKALRMVLTGQLAGEQEYGRWMVEAASLRRAKRIANEARPPAA
jgi:hypothetical protein